MYHYKVERLEISRNITDKLTGDLSDWGFPLYEYELGSK
jgi:hypothetical protein